MKKIISIFALAIITSSLFVSLALAEDTDSDQKIPKIDLVFVIDTTGSMSDEIREVKMHISNIIEDIKNGTPAPDIRVGFVIYRDYADQENEYLYKLYLLTDDFKVVLSNLEEIRASGGGDYEEAVTVGLDVAINMMNWRELDDESVEYDDQQNPIFSDSTVRRMMFLIGDASPRTNPFYDDDGTQIIPLNYTNNIKEAKQKRIVICTIGGSGLDGKGVSIWKDIAKQTFGEYESLTYERQHLDEYIAEEKLDEEWSEKGREMSDYDESTGTISTNNLGRFVSNNIQLQSECMGSSYADSVVHNVGDIGFFFDTSDDCMYDSFYSNEMGDKANFEQKNKDTYLIDSNNDNIWDYTYNSTTETFSLYGEVPLLPREEPEEQKEIWNALFVLLLTVEVIPLIGIIVYLRRNK